MLRWGEEARVVGAGIQWEGRVVVGILRWAAAEIRREEVRVVV